MPEKTKLASCECHRCFDAGEETFTLFSELPAELRLKIWEHTFEPRTVHIYIGESAEPDDGPELESFILHGRCLQITIASDQPLPLTLSICQESRQLSMGRYTTLLTSDPSEIEQVLGTFNIVRFGDVKILGSRCMPIDFERDTLVITDLATPLKPRITSFIDRHRVKNLAWSQATLERQTTWNIDWAKLAATFPNLETLNLVFGDRNCPQKLEGRSVEDHLMPMDSNLEDLFYFFGDQFRRDTNVPGGDQSSLFFEFQQSSTIKENFWTFVTGDTAPPQWFKMVFTTSFWTTKRALDRLVSVGYPMHIDSVHQLPPYLQAKWRDALPRTFWFRRDVCHRDDSLRSRYDGIQLLFSEGESSPTSTSTQG